MSCKDPESRALKKQPLIGIRDLGSRYALQWQPRTYRDWVLFRREPVPAQKHVGDDLPRDEALERVSEEDGEGKEEARDTHQVVREAVVVQEVAWKEKYDQVFKASFRTTCDLVT